MRGQNRISVAMCTYNGSGFLREQLESIAAQTRLPDEMVICDDGSTDTTPEIVAEFARTAPFPIRFIHNPANLGSTRNFEQAISLCNGDLIALCDQDDIWLPEKLARQTEMMENDPELGGVFSDAELVDDRSQPLGKKLWSSIRFTPQDQQSFKAGLGAAVLTRKNVATGATLMFRASARPLVLPIPSCWVHDGWITWMLVAYSQLDFIAEPLVYYRIHASQQIGVQATSRTMTVMERLKKSKGEGAAKRLARLRELELVERRLTATPGLSGRFDLSDLQRNIGFMADLRGPFASRFSQIGCILRHAKDYQRYQNGWKSLFRDIAILFV